MIKPLIKYTGGKFKEYEHFKDFIPSEINNYYEPFLGGGGVLLQLINEKRVNGKLFGNDISSDLIRFYKNVTNKNVLQEMMKLAKCWEEIKVVADNVYDKIGYEFYAIAIKKGDDSILSDETLHDILESSFIKSKLLKEYNYHGINVIKKLENEIKSKLSRFKKKDEIENAGMKLVEVCIETAVLQGFYFVIRDLYNNGMFDKTNEYTLEEKCAHWYFIREFAFGGMFRFSEDGRFNIPYGGISYNKKCIDCKVKAIMSKEVQDAFKKISFHDEDFEKFMTRDYEYGDFIFLDPPYDSTFTDYDKSEFGRAEHIRLRDLLVKTKCNWLLVIRKTDFISKLYKGYIKSEFDKKYAYQARGTYDSKDSIHLIITNLKIK